MSDINVILYNPFDPYPSDYLTFCDETDEPGVNTPHDGHCTRCGCYVSGDTAKVTTKHNKRYCWDCFVDKGYAKHHQYDDLFCVYDDDLVVEVVMGDGEADGVYDLYTPMDFEVFKAIFEEDMLWFDDMVSKMTKGELP